MARENQVLQISLIVCVMFMIGFGVATFMLYRKYDEANNLASETQKKLNAETANLNKATAEGRTLRGYVGSGPEDKIESIGDQFKKDMEGALANLPEAQRTYRRAIEEQGNLLAQRGKELTAEKAMNKSLSDQLATREAVAKPKIDEQTAAAKAADEKLKTATATYDQDRKKIEQDEKRVLDELTAARKSEADIKAQAQARIQQTNAEMADVRTVLVKRSEELAGAKRDTFEKESGIIDSVDQRSGMVWINIGRDDFLRPLQTFSVFDKSSTDVSRAKKKASIEVVQVLGPHSAQAKITEDKLTDPILAGDKIFSAVWTPGEPRHFALIGLMDVDGDDASDLQLVLNLIRNAGGVVDSYREESGNESERRRVGKLTPQTNWVVRGTPPTDKNTPAELKDYSDQVDRATKLNTPVISLSKLLEQMGYRPDSRKKAYGAGADPRQFRAGPPPGAVQKSTGAVGTPYKAREGAREGAAQPK